MNATNLSTLIDQLGEVRARKAAAEAEERKIKKALEELEPGAYEGELFRLSVTKAERETLDMDAVREKLTPQFIRAHTKVTSVRTLRTSSRNGDLD